MTKRFFLIAFMGYASIGGALPVNNLQGSSLVQQVAEGLDDSPPPLATLRDAWDSTFLIHLSAANKRGEWGSAFVVRSQRRGATRILDLVTADHVLGTYCGRRACAQAAIFENADLTINPISGALKANSPVLGQPNLRILARDAYRDLALIQITVDAEVNPVALAVSRTMSRPGDRVWSIGYPDVTARESGAGIRRMDHVVRRWSRGQTLGGVRLTADAIPKLDPTAVLLQANTTDSIKGSSGGPLLDDNGQIVGVNHRSGAQPETDYEYTRKFNPDDIPSVAVEVAALRAFLSEAYGQRVSSLAN